MIDRPAQALQKAVAVLYFADSNDYKTALWDVVRTLSPDMAKLLEQDEAKAFQESQKLQSIAAGRGSPETGGRSEGGQEHSPTL